MIPRNQRLTLDEFLALSETEPAAESIDRQDREGQQEERPSEPG